MHKTSSTPYELLPLVGTWFEQDLIPRLILDEKLAVLHCNDAARSLIDNSPVLTVTRGQFDLTDDLQNAELREYIGTTSQSARVFFLVKQNGHAHLLIRNQRLVADDRFVYGLTLRAVGAASDDQTQGIWREVGLTPTEARILVPLLDGCSAREIADGQGRSSETVRSHIRNIYRKLGVNSRLDLLKVAGTLLR